MKKTWRWYKPWKQVVSDTRYEHYDGQQNMKDTMKLEWKRHTPETANWKATHAMKTTWRRGDTRHENNL